MAQELVEEKIPKLGCLAKLYLLLQNTFVNPITFQQE
jgi:hypothetical protein